MQKVELELTGRVKVTWSKSIPETVGVIVDDQPVAYVALDMLYLLFDVIRQEKSKVNEIFDESLHE